MIEIDAILLKGEADTSHLIEIDAILLEGAAGANHCHDIYTTAMVTPFSNKKPYWCEADTDQILSLTGIYLDLIKGVKVDAGTASIIDQDPYNLSLTVNVPEGVRTLTVKTECNSLDLTFKAIPITWTSNADKGVDIAWLNPSPNITTTANGIQLSEQGSYSIEGASYLLAPANHDFVCKFRVPTNGSYSWNCDFGICKTDNDTIGFATSTDIGIMGMSMRHVVRGGGLWWLYPKVKYEGGSSTALSGRRNYYGDPATNTYNRKDRIVVSRTNGLIEIKLVPISLDNPKTNWVINLATFTEIYHGEAFFNISMSNNNSLYTEYDQFESFYIPELKF